MNFKISVIDNHDSSDVFMSEPMTREDVAKAIPVMLKPSMFGNCNFYLVIIPTNEPAAEN